MKKYILIFILLFNITGHPVYAVEDHEFIELCASGTVQQIQSAIKAGCDVNIATDENGWTPLIMAASMNPDKKVVDALIKAGADVSHKDRDGETALFFAARRSSNPEIIVSLLRAGADPSVKNAKGNLPIEYAIENPKLKGSAALRQLLDASPKIGKRKRVLDDWEFVELCKTGAPADVQSAIQAGANVNAVDDENFWTPLMWAAKENPNAQVITILATTGANVNEKDENDLTPLMLAAAHNPNPDVVASLLSSGADAKMRNSEGKRAIDFAQDNMALKESSVYKLLSDAAPSVDDEAFCQICATGTSEEVKRAIENGANVNATNGIGGTPLMFAASANKNPDVIHIIARAGAKLDKTYKGGITALMLAASNNPNPNVISALVNVGFHVNTKSDEGGTALTAAAVCNSNPEIITTLVKSGADVNAQDVGGHTALMIAAQSTQNPAVLLALLNAGADVKIRNKNGKRAIDFASENKKLQGSEAYQKLLAMDPMSNQAKKTEKHSSSFMALCKKGTPEEIQNAIRAGADVNEIDPFFGMTPLVIAAWQNFDARVIDVLIKAGADVNAAGGTALIAAASSNPTPEVVIALLRAGANANAIDGKGMKAIDYARKNKFLIGTQAFKMLEKATK